MNPEFDCVLIDGDQMMYVTGFASEGEPLNYVLGTLKRSLDKVQRASGASTREIWIKGSGNFRDHVATSKTYKANRTTNKPTYIKEIHDYLVSYQGAQEAHGMEADDMLSVKMYQNQDTHVMYSQDKDLLNTPGWHLNPRISDEPFYINEEEADRHFWHQMLAGDPTDNIPGLPKLPTKAFKDYDIPLVGSRGCGPKRAWEIVNNTEYSDLPQAVYDLYKDYYREYEHHTEELCDEYFREQGQLLWMARELYPDGSPVLWDPEWYGIL